MFSHRNDTQGFKIIFANGYTVSAFFGRGSHTDNKWDGRNESPNVELACWDGEGKWVRLGDHDDVTGWVTPEQFAKFTAFIATGDIVAAKAVFREVS